MYECSRKDQPISNSNGPMGARQLGHTDTTMVKKHYGRWIQKDTPNMAGQVSQMLGYTTDRNGLENPDSAPILPQNQIKK